MKRCRHLPLSPMPLLAMMLLLSVACTVRGQREQSQPQRWHEDSYGISLQPPLDAHAVASDRADVLATFVKGRTYNISVYVRKQEGLVAKIVPRNQVKPGEAATPVPNRPTHMTVVRPPGPEDLMKAAMDQLAKHYLQYAVLEQKPLQVADKPAAIGYFRIPDTERGDFVIGQAFVLFDPETTLVLRLEIDRTDFDLEKAAFEEMVKSVRFEDPQALNEKREAMIRNGEVWRASLKLDAMKQSLIAERWLRIVKGGKDIGYMLQREGEDTELNMPGIRVRQLIWIEGDATDYEEQSTWYMNDANDREVWDTKKYKVPGKERHRRGLLNDRRNRRAQDDENAAPNHAWAESGLRADSLVRGEDGKMKKVNLIQVAPETPSRRLEQQQWPSWPKPDKGIFLSQAELRLIRRHLPATLARTYGFYAYSSQSGKVSFHTERVEPGPAGAYKVFSRYSLGAPETVYHFGRGGELIRFTEPGGREYIVSTPQKIKAIWQLR